MSSDAEKKLDEIYSAALRLKHDQRLEFVRRACGEDEALRSYVESLLAREQASSSFLEPHAFPVGESGTHESLVGQMLGPYRIECLLGSGGMGEVYLAHDSRLQRRVAIKLLPERLIGDAVARERLRREALAAAALDHPFICKIYEVSQNGESVSVVMEYVRGDTLFSRLRAGHIPVPEALRIASEIAEAIEDAHTNRFVHRDLKPSNIMLTPQGHVKVMDFGLAKRLDPDSVRALSGDTALTDWGMIAGTPEYMSPEQATGGSVDHRSDLFSFGIILAQLLTGKHPFLRNSAIETMSAILHDPPDLTTEQEVPPSLFVLVRRLLAKTSAERYASMVEVRADLRCATVAEAGGVEPKILLIGREPEKSAILRSLDAALKGHGSMVLISGEPGIGKTHLTRAILADAVRHGCFTATGHCYEAEGAPPYVPFIEMLEYGARTLPRDSFRYALGDAAPQVAKLMPELRRIFSDIPSPIELPPEQQRRFLFNAYREFVERATKVTPFVAVFEDLHWADESTLLLLQHLVLTLPTIPALIIGTYRDVDLESNRPFARTLESLLREKQATQIPLRRLPPAGAEELLEKLSGQAPPPSVGRILFEQTEGNPFFVESVFRHLADEGRLFDQQGTWRRGLSSAELQVPQNVRLVIGRRLERLSEEARRVLTTAAVIGRSFDLRLLEALESARPDAALDTVEAAEGARMVEPERNGREARYRFVHELIRQTLASSLSLPRRQRLHARIAAVIERIYASTVDAHVPALAHHLYQAGPSVDREKVIHFLSEAARQASRAAAHQEALDHLDNAVSLLENEQAVRAADLRIRRAAVLRSLSRNREAVQEYERALALFDSLGDHARFVETCVPL
jgi:eukaryotic-like serine/threonine-protein kinase